MKNELPITADKAKVLLSQSKNQFRDDLIKELNRKVTEAVNNRVNYTYINIKYYDQVEFIKSLGYKVERIQTGPNEEELKILW